jgi:hypothetical protein
MENCARLVQWAKRARDGGDGGIERQIAALA